MHWVERDGIRSPRAVGGHPALDFCNTWAGWDSWAGQEPTSRSEWLRSYPWFVAWAGYVGLLDADEEAALRRRTDDAAERVVAEARALRTSLHTAVLDPSDAKAMARVTGYVRRAADGLRLVAGYEPRWRVTSRRTVEVPLLRVAWVAGELLTSGRLGDVSECPGDECGWLFLNPSGRRRWCSMDSCGNRAKVRAHAARHR